MGTPITPPHTILGSPAQTHTVLWKEHEVSDLLHCRPQGWSAQILAESHGFRWLLKTKAPVGPRQRPSPQVAFLAPGSQEALPSQAPTPAGYPGPQTPAIAPSSQSVFLYTNNKLSKRNLKKIVQFTIETKRILRNKFKEVKNLYSENYKILMKTTEDDTN